MGKYRFAPPGRCDSVRVDLRIWAGLARGRLRSRPARFREWVPGRWPASKVGLFFLAGEEEGSRRFLIFMV